MMFKVPKHCNFDTSNCNWLVPVSELEKIGYPDYNHAYILPNNTVWVLSTDGENLIKINGTTSENKPTKIKNDDGYLVIKDDETFEVTIDLDIEKVKNNLGIDEIDKTLATKQDKILAGNNIEINNNVISAIDVLTKNDFVNNAILIKNVTDMHNKTQGSNDINSNYIGNRQDLKKLNDPTGQWNELTNEQINDVSFLDGKVYSISSSAKDELAQISVKFDLIAHVDRTYPNFFEVYGAVTLGQKIAVFKQLLSAKGLKPIVYGKGSGPGGNRLYAKIYHVDKSYKGGHSWTGGSIGEISYTVGTEYIQDDGCTYLIIYAPASDGVVPSTVNLDYVCLEYDLLIKVTDFCCGKQKNISVKKDGTGDYKKLRDAIEKSPDNSIIEIYENIKLEEEFTTEEIKEPLFQGFESKNGQTLQGVGDVTISANLNPSLFSETDIKRVSTVTSLGDGTLKNLTIIGEHVRYAFHPESHANHLYCENVKFIKKNAGTYCAAMAGGLRSGQKHKYKNCTFKTEWTGIADMAAAYHSNIDFMDKSYLTFKDCKFETNGSEYGLRLGGMASGQKNEVELIGNRLSSVYVKEELLDGKGIDYVIRGRGNRPLTFTVRSKTGDIRPDFDFVENITIKDFE